MVICHLIDVTSCVCTTVSLCTVNDLTIFLCKSYLHVNYNQLIQDHRQEMCEATPTSESDVPLAYDTPFSQDTSLSCTDHSSSTTEVGPSPVDRKLSRGTGQSGQHCMVNLGLWIGVRCRVGGAPCIFQKCTPISTDSSIFCCGENIQSLN